MRVYRPDVAFAVLRFCSLIICEGISPHFGLVVGRFSFPHYMWGYIDEIKEREKQDRVPSLYVRVYRYSFTAVGLQVSSLIICEGISMIREMMEYIRVFPHYMWGYIFVPTNGTRIQHVPSLYVRVYRSDLLRLWFQNRSLIICEGISVLCISHNSEAAFPHYMWGYICYTSIW